MKKETWVLRPETKKDEVKYVRGALYQFDDGFFIGSDQHSKYILVCLNNGVQYDDPMNKADLERAMNEDGVVMVSESIKIEML
jgi:hypothetical protein